MTLSPLSRLALCACGLMTAAVAYADPTPVVLQAGAGSPQLLVNGQPYYIKGAGGDGPKDALAAAGANTFRTWGVDDTTGPLLDEAQKHGLKVVVGIWLGHERHGFDYSDVEQVAKQFEHVRESVLKHKDHPALLAWGLGNEMEGFKEGGNAAIWSHVQACAALVKQLDPNHPTITVIAEIGGQRVPAIHQLCPDIDIIGINSYGGGPSIPERYKAAGGTKPYIVTEFGPPGTWEVERNSFGVVNELTSTQKAAVYRNVYEKLKADPQCLGSFAFTWGFKQEATATWFGMYLPNGNKAAAVDAMTEAWTGSPPSNRCPAIEPLELSANKVNPGESITVTLVASDPEGEELNVEWKLQAEAEVYFTGGDYQQSPPRFPEAVHNGSATGATLVMPEEPGKYRVYAFIDDGEGGGAMANAPILVKGEAKGPKGVASKLPFVVYDDQPAAPNFAPSGYMGEAEAITMTLDDRGKPFVGDTNLKVTYGQGSGWGGVVWQHPPNDWGDQSGGFDLTGASQLVFHARGDKGGEVVKFGFGLLGDDKPFSDSAGTSIQVTLTQGWKKYTIDLSDLDLSRIKTGFYWTLAADGSPKSFYLDAIRYE
ncbi:MAG: glycoside hydrolase family 2 TIM barrel-domain containing protein [Planctomycetota bacterium]